VLRSFAGLLAVDPGFRYDNVLTTEVQLPGDRYQSIESRQAFWTRAMDEVRALPGAGAISMSETDPAIHPSSSSARRSRRSTSRVKVQSAGRFCSVTARPKSWVW
jgi:hypothetical protein